MVEEDELGGVDGLAAGAAAVVPTGEGRLQEPDHAGER